MRHMQASLPIVSAIVFFSWQCIASNYTRYELNLYDYVPPQTGGGAELPQPDQLILKYVTLGQGTQNYTCLNTSTPIATGAMATLYDVTGIFHDAPVVLESALLGGLTGGAPSGLQKMGIHFFGLSGAPIFDLGPAGYLVGSKVAQVSAPPNANPGFNGYGAIPWLRLNGTAGSSNLSVVYRVETSGGSPPPNCYGQAPNLEISYEAQYFFYDNV